MKKLIFLFFSILFSFSLIGQRDSVTTFLRTYQNIDTVNLSGENKITTTYKSNSEGTVTSIDTTEMTVSGYINMLITQAQADSVVYRINRESFYSAYQEASTNYLNNARYLQKLHAVAGNVFELPTVGVRGVAEGGAEGQILSKASSDDFDTEWVTTSAQPLIYRALLTQSGGDDPQNLTSGSLTVGVTYEISDNTGADFTNVGAPNNTVGTFFVASGTTPTAWGTGQLDYNTGAPVVTVLENTLGNVYYTFLTDGYYYLTATGLIPTANTSIFNKEILYTDSVGDGIRHFVYKRVNSNVIELQTGIVGDSQYNDILINTPIQIIVYP